MRLLPASTARLACAFRAGAGVGGPQQPVHGVVFALSLPLMSGAPPGAPWG